jgi:hypothetical protein
MDKTSIILGFLIMSIATINQCSAASIHTDGEFVPKERHLTENTSRYNTNIDHTAHKTNYRFKRQFYDLDYEETGNVDFTANLNAKAPGLSNAFGLKSVAVSSEKKIDTLKKLIKLKSNKLSGLTQKNYRLIFIG